MFQVYNTVIQNFYRLYSIYSCYKMLAVCSVLNTVSLYLVCIIQSGVYLNRY